MTFEYIEGHIECLICSINGMQSVNSSVHLEVLCHKYWVLMKSCHHCGCYCVLPALGPDILAQALTLVACIQEVPSSDLSQAGH